MASIAVSRDVEQDLTAFTVRGDLTADEIVGALSGEYAARPTSAILWVLTAGSLNALTADGFRRIAEIVKAIRPVSPVARTAYVGSEDREYGLMRMYVALAESAGVPVNHRIFRSRAAAVEWLTEVTPPRSVRMPPTAGGSRPPMIRANRNDITRPGLLLPDRLPSLILLVGFWIPPAVAGWMAAGFLRRGTGRSRTVLTCVVLALFVLGSATAWFFLNLGRMPPYIPGAFTDPAFASPEAVAGLVTFTSALILPGSALACVLAYWSHARLLRRGTAA